MATESVPVSRGDVRKFASRVLLLLVLLFALDRLGGALAEHWFLKTRDGDTGEEVNALLATRPQVVVFGDSRAESHYSPGKLSDALGVSAFNGGFKGSNTIFQFGLEQLVFDHYIPRLIVLDFSEFSLMRGSGDPYLKLAPLHPYWRSPGLWSVIGEQGRRAQLWFLSRLYPFNSKIHSIVMFNVLASRPHAQSGFVPQFGTIPAAPLGLLDRRPIEYDERLVSYLERFLVSAHSQGVMVAMVISPRYATGSFRIPAPIARRIAEFNIPVLDFSVESYPQFADPRLYHDNSHLNFEGAEAFSELLGQELCQRYCEALRR
jgi:hypothetical protein